MDGFKFCKWCGAQIASSAKFCTNCGASVAPAQEASVKYCRSCGRQLNPQASYCPICGQDQTGTRDPYKRGPVTQRDLQKMANRQRAVENRAQGVACCPKCGSPCLSANTKGYGIGKGVIGMAAVGPIGLVAGNIGRHKVLVTCLNCGHRFKPGW